MTLVLTSQALGLVLTVLLVSCVQILNIEKYPACQESTKIKSNKHRAKSALQGAIVPIQSVLLSQSLEITSPLQVALTRSPVQ